MNKTIFFALIASISMFSQAADNQKELIRQENLWVKYRKKYFTLPESIDVKHLSVIDLREPKEVRVFVFKKMIDAAQKDIFTESDQCLFNLITIQKKTTQKFFSTALKLAFYTEFSNNRALTKTSIKLLILIYENKKEDAALLEFINFFDITSTVSNNNYFLASENRDFFRALFMYGINSDRKKIDQINEKIKKNYENSLVISNEKEGEQLLSALKKYNYWKEHFFTLFNDFYPIKKTENRFLHFENKSLNELQIELAEQRKNSPLLRDYLQVKEKQRSSALP